LTTTSTTTTTTTAQPKPKSSTAQAKDDAKEKREKKQEGADDSFISSVLKTRNDYDKQRFSTLTVNDMTVTEQYDVFNVNFAVHLNRLGATVKTCNNKWATMLSSRSSKWAPGIAEDLATQSVICESMSGIVPHLFNLAKAMCDAQFTKARKPLSTRFTLQRFSAFICLFFHISSTTRGVDYEFRSCLAPLLLSWGVDFTAEDFHVMSSALTCLPSSAHSGPGEDLVTGEANESYQQHKSHAINFCNLANTVLGKLGGLAMPDGVVTLDDHGVRTVSTSVPLSAASVTNPRKGSLFVLYSSVNAQNGLPINLSIHLEGGHAANARNWMGDIHTPHILVVDRGFPAELIAASAEKFRSGQAVLGIVTSTANLGFASVSSDKINTAFLDELPDLVVMQGVKPSWLLHCLSF